MLPLASVKLVVRTTGLGSDTATTNTGEPLNYSLPLVASGG
jgi:hypothetical protein